VIAGGVDLGNALDYGLISPKVLINLKNVSGLAGMIEDEKKGLSIEALVTL
jgi:CO/xanthine dehydrogenase FAD-binding subunit